MTLLGALTLASVGQVRLSGLKYEHGNQARLFLCYSRPDLKQAQARPVVFLGL
jgi:hypothetical protein